MLPHRLHLWLCREKHFAKQGGLKIFTLWRLFWENLVFVQEKTYDEGVKLKVKDD